VNLSVEEAAKLEEERVRSLDYVLVKERKFGDGCVDRWLQEREELVARVRSMLAPTERSLAAQPFLFGITPTLADARRTDSSRCGHAGDPALLFRFSSTFIRWISRFEEHAPPVMSVSLAY
jgi:glutathione S-transferase